MFSLKKKDVYSVRYVVSLPKPSAPVKKTKKTIAAAVLLQVIGAFCDEAALTSSGASAGGFVGAVMLRRVSLERNLSRDDAASTLQTWSRNHLRRKGNAASVAANAAEAARLAPDNSQDKKNKNRAPLTVRLLSGEVMRHTDAEWEFLDLKSDAVVEVGEVMRLKGITLFLEGEEDQLHPNLRLDAIDAERPLFALQDPNLVVARLREIEYKSPAERAEAAARRAARTNEKVEAQKLARWEAAHREAARREVARRREAELDEMLLGINQARTRQEVSIVRLCLDDMEIHPEEESLFRKKSEIEKQIETKSAEI